VNGADLGALLASWGICPVLAPTISLVNPNYGPQTGGTVFLINGANLNVTMSVTVGGVAATILAKTPTVLAAAAPASATLGAKDVIVTTPGGTATAVGAFTYNSSSVPSWATVIEFAPNPAVVTNATMRAAITATGLAWRVRDTATQIEMLLVPPGAFMMGCTASNVYGCNPDENPTHSVTLTQAFYMGRYEVTQGQWVATMGSNPSYFQGYSDSASRPVELVSWSTVQSYLSATCMRLPSEAEWEYACRAGTTTAFNNGSSDDATVGTIAWYLSNSGIQTHAVGGKAANALGLYDMSGNVDEWVNDRYGPYSSGAQTNPLGPVSGTARVFRGGAWFADSGYVRSSDRGGSSPGGAGDGLGFRVAKAP
jgi:formylglycine-generating enzyme required for sulfatase activity